jgi:alanine dehydrogenase
MKYTGTLLLTRQDVSSLLTIEESIDCVERAFRLYGEGKTVPPGILGVHAEDGGFHIKAGLLNLERPYFAAKVNANFPENPQRFGLPLIQGVIVLCDAECGYPLSVMDSIEITSLRTGAATAVAAKYLARANSTSITICGCGNQGRVSLRALATVFQIERVFAYDCDSMKAERFSTELSQELGVPIQCIVDLAEAINQSDLCVTCTPSNQFYLKRQDVRPGTFIAAVGADSENKQELEPDLVASGTLVVDILEQCASIGELHHAMDAGLMSKQDVHGELGEIVAELRPGRTSSDEITIFDSTGMALQDVITAATVYEEALKNGCGNTINFN